MSTGPSDEVRDVLACGPEEVVLNPYSTEITQRLEHMPLERLEECYRRLSLLYELGQAICRTMDQNQVLSAVVDAMRRLLPLERCFVAKLEPDGRLRSLATHNIVLGDAVEEWPVSHTMLRRVLSKGISVLTRDASKDEDFAELPSVTKHCIRSVMAVPLGLKKECMGVVYADNRETAGSFSETDLLFFTALTHYVYLGIRNAGHFERTAHQLRLSDERCAALHRDLLKQHEIVGGSQRLLAAYEKLLQLAPTNLPILLYGETGTGKELFARAIHRESRRAAKPFIPANMAAIPDALADSELFGYEQGAFTGAERRKPGWLELAHEGTFFIDEVAETPLHVQAKLLRALESGDFLRVGGSESVRVDIRLVCASFKNLKALVKEGRFRQDLYFRIAGDEIVLPPLRDRPDDVPALVEHFSKRAGAQGSFSEPALRMLQNHAWPGNVRELRNVVESVLAQCGGSEVTADDVVRRLQQDSNSSARHFPTLDQVVENVEREHIQRTLDFCQGHRARAIQLLGIAKGTFYDKLRRYGLM
jgi:transcriptional regulator with GAF, ATPase, and Fis domain